MQLNCKVVYLCADKASVTGEKSSVHSSCPSVSPYVSADPTERISVKTDIGILDFKLSPCSVGLCFLLGNCRASGVYMPTFRNTLFHLHRQVDESRMN